MNINLRYVTKSGKPIWANVSASPIMDEHGNYNGALAMVSDITEKRKLTELLNKSNNLARIGNWEVDLLNNKIIWSALTKEIHEVDHDFNPDLETAINFFKEGPNRKSIRHAIQEAITQGKSWDLELQIITAKGNTRWVRSIGDSEYLSGKSIRLYGSLQDIDVRKKSQMEVLLAYEDRNSILESIGDGFYAVDKNWIITYWNKEAENLLGRDRKEMIGKNLWMEFAGSKNTATYVNSHKAIKENTAQHYEVFNNTLKRWIELSAYPSQNGLSVYFKDITNRKLSEIYLNELNENLLQQAKELASSNKDLEQFSYIVSHNLRAPVANIIALAEELSDDEYDGEMKKQLNAELTLSVKRLDNVIIDLNNILKVKSAINERKELIKLSELVEDIKSSISKLIQIENVHITTDFTEANEFTSVKSYLHSIFHNLILNSIRYHQPTISPLIEIKSKKHNKNLIIIFKDNGSGIDLTKRGDQVFSLYKRFHQNIEGKGMGLFMVKTQVEALGGKISIKSEVNKGTEFTIEFEA